MWKYLFLTQARRQFAILVCQIVALILCVIYIEYVFLTNVVPDKAVQSSFKQTECFLISKRLLVERDLIRLYRADFYVSYNVQGMQFNRWASGNGLDTSFNSNQSEEENILNRYDIGGTYMCSYNPALPGQVVLVARHRWFAVFPLLIPMVLGVIAFYYFMKTLLRILRQRYKKARD